MQTRKYTPALGLLMVMFLLVMSTGCSNARFASLDPQVVPSGFELTIGMYDTKGKHTYMTLDDQGELSFAGGRAAIMRQPYPVITLTPAQRQEVWSQIVTSKMLTTKNQMFKSPKNVAYDVEVDPGKSFNSRSFHVVDEAVPPAVIKLHDYLFEIQAAEQYKPQLPAKSTR